MTCHKLDISCTGEFYSILQNIDHYLSYAVCIAKGGDAATHKSLVKHQSFVVRLACVFFSDTFQKGFKMERNFVQGLLCIVQTGEVKQAVGKPGDMT